MTHSVSIYSDPQRFSLCLWCWYLSPLLFYQNTDATHASLQHTLSLSCGSDTPHSAETHHTNLIKHLTGRYKVYDLKLVKLGCAVYELNSSDIYLQLSEAGLGIHQNICCSVGRLTWKFCALFLKAIDLLLYIEMDMH